MDFCSDHAIKSFECATPIPRSLALTLYGDLDVSVLDERPPGRQPVTTLLRNASAHEKVMAFLNRELEKGRQGYIVYPIIEESDKLALKAATTMYQELSEGALKGRRLALLHADIHALGLDAVDLDGHRVAPSLGFSSKLP